MPDTIYTVTARNIHRIHTSTYNNPASAFAAYFWYRWDMAAEIITSDGRTIAHSYRDAIDERTEGEQESAERQHFLYYWERERRAPDSILGHISTTTRTNDYTYADIAS